MIALSRFHELEIFSFFAMVVRLSVLSAILPITGDRVVPVPAKILLAVAFAVVIYPVCVGSGWVNPAEASVWSESTWGIVRVIFSETFLGLIVGFLAKIVFEVLTYAGDIIGGFMGLSSAAVYDPHFESQTQVIGQLLGAFGVLFFLAIDGHHLMLRAMSDSFSIIGIGKTELLSSASMDLIRTVAELIRVALQISAPIAVSFFLVNIVYGVMARAIPQLNVLVLSFSVSALVGMMILSLSYPEMMSVAGDVFGTLGNRMIDLMGKMR